MRRWDDRTFRLLGTSFVVPGWPGGVGTTRRKRPTSGAGCCLFHCPVGCLLSAVVSATSGGEVALIGGSVGPGVGVVEVGAEGFGLTARGIAGGRAGTDQVAELAAGGVTDFPLHVVTGVLGHGREGETEAPQEFSDVVWRGLGLRGAGAGSLQALQKGGMLAGGAGMGLSGAVGGCEGCAPAGAGVRGGGLGDGPGLVAVEQSPAAGLGRRGRPAEQRADRDGDVD